MQAPPILNRADIGEDLEELGCGAVSVTRPLVPEIFDMLDVGASLDLGIDALGS